MIGFFNPSYQASESDEFVTVEFGIMDGSLQAEMSIELFLMNQSNNLCIPLTNLTV